MTTLTQTTTGPTGLVLYTETWDDTTGIYTRTGQGATSRARTGQGATSRALTPAERAALATRAIGEARAARQTALVNAIAWLHAHADTYRNAPPATTGNAVSYVETLRQDMPVFMDGLADLLAHLLTEGAPASSPRRTAATSASRPQE